MTPIEFIRKWKPVALTERQTAQEHFIDLCRLVGHPTPVESDPTGESYCFEKGALKSSGTPGFADVWKRGHFAFEYKKRKKNLGEALKQLSQYSWDLENPPINVACDTAEFYIKSAWTNMPTREFRVKIDELVDNEKFAIIHAIFHDPRKLAAAMTRADLTREAADKFSGIAQRLQSRGHDPEVVAHFVMQLVFCFFAEDVKLLPDGLFRSALKNLTKGLNWMKSKPLLDDLFRAMAQSGGRFGVEFLPHFNGGLFSGQEALPLDDGEVGLLVAAGSMRWGEIDPSIFGTLFERFLDPAKRAQIGAHYTDARKILQIVEPVVMRPLLAEWDDVRARIDTLVASAKDKGDTAKEWAEAAAEETRFIERLATLRILDPACGSGNFLYMALQRVKDLELEVVNHCEQLGLKRPALRVGPEILHGIEINRLAAEIARATIWIGDIQWGMAHSVYTRPDPILRPLDAIECRDALMQQKPDGTWEEAPWPEADFIIGNPPFLGGKLLRRSLEDDYVNGLFKIYDGRIPREADLVCYWVARAWEAMKLGKVERAGLVTTNSIRGGANRKVLDPVAAAGAIFEAWSDEEWINDGAAVRVSLVCFGGQEAKKFVDGKSASDVFSDLSVLRGDLTQIGRLRENVGCSFQGFTKGAPFEVSRAIATNWLLEPLNANSEHNASVLRPLSAAATLCAKENQAG